VTRRPRHDGTWPALGARALLGAPGETPRATRVEDVDDDGGAVAVTVPRALAGELEPPQPGDAFELSWPGPRGLVVVPVVLRERVRDGIPLWWLEPSGPTAVDQRRSYVRAEVSAPFPVRVALDWELPERGAAAGELQDLSEGGLRVHLRGAGADGCPEGAGVGIRLTVVDVVAGDGSSASASGSDSPGAAVGVDEHELFGTVLRSGRLAEAPEVVEAVVQLHEGPEGPRQGDALRRLVFAWQRRARQR